MARPARTSAVSVPDCPQPSWNKNLLEYVHARTPKTLQGVQDQIRDHSTTTLALPLNLFIHDRNGFLVRELSRVANANLEHFKRMYGEPMKLRMGFLES